MKWFSCPVYEVVIDRRQELSYFLFFCWFRTFVEVQQSGYRYVDVYAAILMLWLRTAYSTKSYELDFKLVGHTINSNILRRSVYIEADFFHFSYIQLNLNFLFVCSSFQRKPLAKLEFNHE